MSAILIYLGVATALIYGVVDDRAPGGAWVVLGAGIAFVFLLAHPVLGYVSRTSWWMLLPLMTIVLAVPTGYPNIGGEPFPTWYAFAIYAPFLMALIGVGYGVRLGLDRMRGRAVTFPWTSFVPIWITIAYFAYGLAWFTLPPYASAATLLVVAAGRLVVVGLLSARARSS